MDLWKYFAIGHQHHVICNPLSEAKLDELVERLALDPGARLLDIGCGKGDFLARVVRRYGCGAVGIDLSPYAVADARAAAAGLEPSPEILEANGSDYTAPVASFDTCVCLGASWIWGGLRGTLDALAHWTRSGGTVVVGEPFWKREPSAEHLVATGHRATSFASHAGNVEIGLDANLGFLQAIVSSDDDWDRYEGLQSYAAERWALREPDDPDVAEVLGNLRKARDHYLRWGRDEIGWAVYLFVKDPARV